jgi:hypothetical protein
MHQSVPTKELPNGKFIWRDSRGTFSHQFPDGPQWCEGHKTVSEALLCFQEMEREKSAKTWR